MGLRSLQGAPERSYERVQITNMSLTTAEERGRAVFYVRALDSAAGVEGAKITFEVRLDPDKHNPNAPLFAKTTLTTDAQGRAVLEVHPEWQSILRMIVAKGDDVLVFDPHDPPPQFMNNHWSTASGWLSHLTVPVSAPVNDKALGFLFTERPIYRPGEKVFLKGYARNKTGGVLSIPAITKTSSSTIKITGPGGQERLLPATRSALAGFDAVFAEADPPTGQYVATLVVDGTAIATRVFQIEAYRVPQFEVQLTGPSKARLDAPFKVRALARYYAGGNVAHEKIKWSVTRRPWRHVPKGREGFLFASSAQFARPEAKQADERTEKSGELNDDGSDEIEVNPALDLDGSPRIYRFEATVTGADNQDVSAVTDVEALPPFTLGMKLPRYSKSALTLEPEIIAVGVDDKLLAGQKVTARLYKRTWHSHLRESQFATGQASYVTEQEDKKIGEVEVISGADVVRAKLPVAEAGVYLVELTARDKLGRMQTLTADLYVGGKEPVAWQKGQAGVFELAPDKDKYAPGETAHIVVKSPFTKAKALVIVEQPGQNSYSIIDIDNGQATVDVTVGKENVPNLPVHVVLMRGRLGDGQSDDAPYRPQTMGSTVELAVTPVKNTVTVDVKHPDSARPGSTVDFAIALKDDKGAPLAGEVTLWLVDEAVLSLASEGTLDPLTSFIVPNQRVTSVTDTRNKIVGRVLEEEAPGAGGSEDDKEQGEGMPHRRIRKNFQTVPYYAATLQVPDSGKLTVPIKLSDDLTNFMVRAVVVSGAMRFGNFEDRLKVRLPVLVQPQLPRFVRQGDHFDGGGVARVVEGSEGPAVLKMEISGPVDAEKRSKDIKLALNKAQSVTFPIEVKSVATRDELKVKVDVYRKSDGVGDAFEVTIPVLPDRSIEDVTTLESWSAGAHALAPLPEPARPGTLKQEVTATTIPGLLELAAAFDYTSEYPHGCLEQKMSALAGPLAQAQLGTLISGVDSGTAAKGNIARLVAEMAQHQGDDGLFGLWPGSHGSVQLTADALEFATQAEQIGVKLDAKVRTRAVDALRRSLRSDYGGFL
ncbi:MAG TPA: alpha-2-macroglobulin family protein, partial [Myxococcota bacterium]